MHIFIDDIRTPIDDGWIIARTVEESIDLINECISNNEEIYISFDHDLGGDKTTREVINYMLRNGIVLDGAAIHSANPVGAAWIGEALLRDWPSPVKVIESPSYKG